MAMADHDDFDFDEWLNFSPAPASPVQDASGTVAVDSREALPRAGNNDSMPKSILSTSQAAGIALEDFRSTLTRDGTNGGTLTSDNPGDQSCSQPSATLQSSFRTLKPKHLQTGENSLKEKAVSFVHSNQSTLGKLPKESRKRRRLNQDGDSYKETRSVGACARCWIRRIKCGHSGHCIQCVKAAIPPELCCRTRVKDLSNHRPGLAHKFIDFFQGCIVRWDKLEEQKEVKLWHGLHSSFSVKVTQFTARQDIVDLWWKNPSGWMKTRHTPFGIYGPLDIDSKTLDSYIYAQIPFILDRVQAKNQDQGMLPSQYAPEVSPSRRTSAMRLRTMRAIHSYVEGESESQGTLQGALLLWTYTFLIYHGLWQFTADENHDRLVMAQLALKNHDCETLTNFNDATPLPRLLLLQIHTCMEARMHLLEKSLVSELHRSYVSVSRSAHTPDGLILYLTTWVYLSVLEEIAWDAGRWNNLLEQFEWPLERTPDSNYEEATHSAKTVLAHCQSAFKKEKVSQIYTHLLDYGEPRELGKEHCPSELNVGRYQSMQVLFRELSSFAARETSELDRRMNAAFRAEDIRSLEMKFAAMMIS